MKKSDRIKAKEKAWKWFSLYIRLRDSDNYGNAKCVTCGVVKNYKEQQAGHFVDGRNNAVLFNEELVHVQDYACNVMRKGNKVAYTLFMLKKGYTQDDIERFYNLKHKTLKISIPDLEEIASMYKEKVNQLMLEKEL